MGKLFIGLKVVDDRIEIEHLGEKLVITYTGFKNNWSRNPNIGIEAPKTFKISIHRKVKR